MAAVNINVWAALEILFLSTLTVLVFATSCFHFPGTTSHDTTNSPKLVTFPLLFNLFFPKQGCSTSPLKEL